MDGFENDFFKQVKIAHVWMSPAFNLENDPNLTGLKELQNAIGRGITALLARTTNEEEQHALKEMKSISENANKTIENLEARLPDHQHVVFVNAKPNTPLPNIFTSNDVALKVLSPEPELAEYYLGNIGLTNFEEDAMRLGAGESYEALFQLPKTIIDKYPTNISEQDFDQLRGRVYANVKAAAEISGHIINNLSVVLMLEWHGMRLLFPGDAEFRKEYKGLVKPKAYNGSWNVMSLKQQSELSQRVTFLKIGHHGSVTATPWDPDHPENPVNLVFEQILPSTEPKAWAGMSTKRGPHPTIPDIEVMNKVSERLCDRSKKFYTEEIKKNKETVKFSMIHPKRTDLETDKDNNKLPYLDFEFIQ